MAKKLDLAAAIGSAVSELDTGREQIEYIEEPKLHGDDENFYSMEGIEALAQNIELVGLQQPLRVRPDPDDEGGYIVVSGHRRLTAIRTVCKVDEPERWRTVPCIVERGEMSPAMRELRLIYANSDTRRMSNADLSAQAERVEKLLYQLQEEGVEFPGRMRDHVAEVCQISKSKLARLKVIRANLMPKLKKAWEKGKISESAAYAFAQNPLTVQEKAYFYLTNRAYECDPDHWTVGSVEYAANYAKALMDLTCKESGGCCDHQDDMLLRLTCGSVYSCACSKGKCCSACSELASCKKSCPKLADKVKKLRADRKAERAHEAEVRAEKDRPTIGRISSYWRRFGEARLTADVSVKSWFKAMGMYYSSGDADQVYAQRENGQKIKADTDLPYGYGFSYQLADRLCKAADRFGCSLDYLLCRSDDPQPVSSLDTEPEWRTGEPPKAGEYYACFDIGKNACRLATWSGWDWRFSGGATIEAPCLGWWPLPARGTKEANGGDDHEE